MLIPNPSPTGFYARYWTEDEFLGNKPSRRRPVVGWDDLGNPLTLGDKGKRVRAEDLPDFHSVAQEPHLVTALPGDGWRVIWQPVPDTKPVVASVVSWAVYSDGSIRPIANILGEQYMQPLDLSDGDLEIVPPARDAAGVCLSCGRKCGDPFDEDFVAITGCGGATPTASEASSIRPPGPENVPNS